MIGEFFNFKKDWKRGFTLVEMLVSIAILMIITSAAVGNFGAFNEELALTNLAYDIALTIREAQYYGISNKISGSEAHGYGVSFDTNRDKEYVFFVNKLDDNKLFDGDCNSKTECLTRYELKKGNHISKISELNGGSCTPEERVDVVYERPSPKVYISFDMGSDADRLGTVLELSSASGLQRYITIRKSGYVSVSRTSPCTLN